MGTLNNHSNDWKDDISAAIGASGTLNGRETIRISRAHAIHAPAIPEQQHDGRKQDAKCIMTWEMKDPTLPGSGWPGHSVQDQPSPNAKPHGPFGSSVD